MKKIFCCPALKLFHCLPLWKTVLFVSTRAFSLSTPLFHCPPMWKTMRLHGKKLQNATNNFSLFWLHSFFVLLAFFLCLLYRVSPVLLKTQIYRDFPVMVTTFLCSNYRIFPALITPFSCFGCTISLFYQHFFPA